MLKTVLLVLAAFPGLAQQSNTNMTPAMQWAQLMANMQQQGNEAIAQGIAAGQRQQVIDLERERFEWEKKQARQSSLLRDRVLDPSFGYRDARHEMADWRINQDVIDAFKSARTVHPDFDALQPIMRIVAEAVRPNWQLVTMSEYIECLYAIAKHAGFTEPARQKLAALQPSN